MKKGQETPTPYFSIQVFFLPLELLPKSILYLRQIKNVFNVEHLILLLNTHVDF